jgi:hypothetical protein
VSVQAADGAALQLRNGPIDGLSVEDGLNQMIDPLFVRSHVETPGTQVVRLLRRTN